MAFSPQQKDDFLTYLQSIDKQVAEKLPPRETGEFFTILIDYSVEEDAFELKIAQLFYKIPEMLEEMKDSIKDISVVRHTMLDQSGVNAEEARELTIDFFIERIDEFIELASYEEAEAEDALNTVEKKRRQERKTEKRRMEKELQKLQEERQMIFEFEKEERIKRQQKKKKVESAIQQKRQEEHEQEIEERKERKKKVEEEIKVLQKNLQAQHEKETEERKEVRKRKQIELKARQDVQLAEQNKQAQARKAEKEQEIKMMEARQNELLSEQERQSHIRMDKKKHDEEARLKAIQAIKEEQNKKWQEKKKKKLLGDAPKPIIDIRKGDTK